MHSPDYPYFRTDPPAPASTNPRDSRDYPTRSKNNSTPPLTQPPTSNPNTPTSTLPRSPPTHPTSTLPPPSTTTPRTTPRGPNLPRILTTCGTPSMFSRITKKNCSGRSTAGGTRGSTTRRGIGRRWRRGTAGRRGGKEEEGTGGRRRRWGVPSTISRCLL